MKATMKTHALHSAALVMSQPILVLENDKAVGEHAAQLVFSALRRASDEGRAFVLGCPSGRTPRSTYKALAQLIDAHGQSISHVTIAMMDEYLLQHADGTFSNVDVAQHFSCTGFAVRDIYDVLNAAAPAGGKMPLANVRFPDARSPGAYEDFLRSAGVNVFLVASGASDGHVAFNPAGTGRQERTRIVRIADETREDNLGTFPDFKSLNEVPEYGVSVGPATLADVPQLVVMLLIGAHKRQAFDRIAAAAAYECDWPSTIVRDCSSYCIIADSAAAGR